MARSSAARTPKRKQPTLLRTVRKQRDNGSKKNENHAQWADLQLEAPQTEHFADSEKPAVETDVSRARELSLNDHVGTGEHDQDHDSATMNICNDDEDAAALGDSFFDVVAIDVGTGAARETFKIVKSHAIARSRFFFHTLSVSNGHSDQSILLPDVEAEIFEYFHDFLRMGLVLNRDFKGDVTSTLHQDLRYGRDWERLAKAWLLGEKLQSIPFRDAVVDAMIRKVLERGETPLDLYRVLYRSDVKKKACIKRLLLDIALWTWKEDVFSNEIIREDLQENPDFFFDMAETLAKVRWSGLDPVPFYERNACYYYHEHVEEHRRYYRESRYASHEMQEKQEEALVRAEHPRSASPVQDEVMASSEAPSPVLAPEETVSTSELPSPTAVQDTEMVEDSSPAPVIEPCSELDRFETPPEEPSSPPTALPAEQQLDASSVSILTQPSASLQEPEQIEASPIAPSKVKKYYAVLSSRPWNGLSNEQRARMAHVTRIEETEAGKLRTPSCRRCRDNGWTCRVYKEEVRQQNGNTAIFRKCARCIFDKASTAICANYEPLEQIPIDLTG